LKNRVRRDKGMPSERRWRRGREFDERRARGKEKRGGKEGEGFCFLHVWRYFMLY
jgi:hypothetical protein